MGVYHGSGDSGSHKVVIMCYLGVLAAVSEGEKYIYLKPLTSWILSVITHILLQLIDGSQIHLARAQQVACASITE